MRSAASPIVSIGLAARGTPSSAAAAVARSGCCGKARIFVLAPPVRWRPLIDRMSYEPSATRGRVKPMVTLTDRRDHWRKIPIINSPSSRNVFCCKTAKSANLKIKVFAWAGTDTMSAADSRVKSPARVVSGFLLEYYNIWDKHFPGLNKRAHWHVIFMARTCKQDGVSSRTIHRALYGSYGTDIRTCIERIKDCERDGFIKVFDEANRQCAASPGCLIGPTEGLVESFDAHCRATIVELCGVAGNGNCRQGHAGDCDGALVSEFYRFFGDCDRKWREISEQIVRKRGLTPAHIEDAMDHLVTYQYWAIVMLLWAASASGSNRIGPPALVIDEIISRMWDRLRLGHLAIKERVANLIRWGLLTEQTIKKHKAVALSQVAEQAISIGLAEMQPLLFDLHQRLATRRPVVEASRVA
jgi:hypothetical protein